MTRAMSAGLQGLNIFRYLLPLSSLITYFISWLTIVLCLLENNCLTSSSLSSLSSVAALTLTYSTTIVSVTVTLTGTVSRLALAQTNLKPDDSVTMISKMKTNTNTNKNMKGNGKGNGNSSIESLSSSSTATTQWDHVVDLNQDFRILWRIVNQDITFEIQAHTLGYVGFGFSPDGNLAGSDIAIGWVDNGQTYFQDRHIKKNNDPEPVIDPSQDYILIWGYENRTHTVLKFRRKLDTCDSLHDITITNDTMRLLYMYNEHDPPHGTIKKGFLPNPIESFHPYRPMVLTQQSHIQFKQESHVRLLELRNEDVELPGIDETLIWCKMFKLDDMKHKHHLIRYEPIYDTATSAHYLQHITLRECHGMHQDLEEMARELGRPCMGARDIPLACQAIVASWSRGSNSFTYPDEAGYPMESHQAKYYLMETHYNNLYPDLMQLHGNRQMADNSGLKIYFTRLLRRHDAGVLSIGMDPNWRHIIPPGQNQVISEGHCIEDCTAYALPRTGVHIFAVMMSTHLIGREVKLRHIRETEELPPIAQDSNIDIAYQDFRRLIAPVHVLPGDRLIAECIYDSSTRRAITLGGLTMKEECCIVLTLYYPRQNKLTTCHSLPSLPTVLHSLGIEQLATDSNPVLISAPPELAGMTLEIRLLSYDWQNQFNEFQEATRKGSFKPLCWGTRNHVVPGTEYLEGYSINVTKTYRKQRHCKHKRLFVTEETISDIRFPVLHEVNNNDIIVEGAARSSRSSSSSNSSNTPNISIIISIIIILTIIAVISSDTNEIVMMTRRPRYRLNKAQGYCWRTMAMAVATGAIYLLLLQHYPHHHHHHYHYHYNDEEQWRHFSCWSTLWPFSWSLLWPCLWLWL